MPPFVDIHCHVLPGLDDGAKNLAESLAMCRMAAIDGMSTILATPHQLGAFSRNRGDDIRQRTAQLQEELDRAGIPLAVLPGADVRVESGLSDLLATGDVLTLGDHRRHVLLELPHDVYLPLEPVLADLARAGVVAILSHPERNAGLLGRSELLGPLVDEGCLMQVTAGSFAGAFGPRCQQFAEWMLSEGLVHFVATDAHGSAARRPLMRRAFERVIELTDKDTAVDLCCRRPALVAAGRDVPAGRRAVPKKASWWRGLTRGKAG
jgi:protein-tyrosine phosphatase